MKCSLGAHISFPPQPYGASDCLVSGHGLGYVGRRWLFGVAPRKNGLSNKQQAFLEWLVTPKGLRDPETQDAWGRANQVGGTTLRAWKKDLVFRAAWDARLAELQVDPEKIDEVMTALFRKATAGDTKAISMYLEVADRYRPQVDINVKREPSPLTELDDDALEALLASHVEDELAARRAARA